MRRRLAIYAHIEVALKELGLLSFDDLAGAQLDDLKQHLDDAKVTFHHETVDLYSQQITANAFGDESTRKEVRKLLSNLGWNVR